MRSDIKTCTCARVRFCRTKGQWQFFLTSSSAIKPEKGNTKKCTEVDPKRILIHTRNFWSAVSTARTLLSLWPRIAVQCPQLRHPFWLGLCSHLFTWHLSSGGDLAALSTSNKPPFSGHVLFAFHDLFAIPSSEALKDSLERKS